MKVDQIAEGITVGTKDIDFYVPVKIIFTANDAKNEELFYYRIFNPRSSFVELSINSVSKRIVEITLVSVNDVMEIEHLRSKKWNLYEKTGNPIVNMSVFKEGTVKTDYMDFGIVREKKKIYVFPRKIEIQESVSMDHVDLLLDGQKNIVGFIFKDFSEKEWKKINESIDNSLEAAKKEFV